MDPRELAPVIEEMWRAGMLYHEIADVFQISSGSVHRLIRERVPLPERTAQTVARREDGRSSDERLMDGIRRAASMLAEGPGGGERGRAQELIGRWLEAHGEPPGAPPAGARTEPLSAAELHQQLDRFKAELRAVGLRESTIHAYLLGSSLFVRWLAGDYVPGPRRIDRDPDATPPEGAGRHAARST